MDSMQRSPQAMASTAIFSFYSMIIYTYSLSSSSSSWIGICKVLWPMKKTANTNAVMVEKVTAL
jgi:hypothetical protein